MENEKDTPRQLLFLEPVNKDSSEEELVKRLIIRLESLGFNIIGNFLVEGNVVGRRKVMPFLNSARSVQSIKK